MQYAQEARVNSQTKFKKMYSLFTSAESPWNEVLEVWATHVLLIVWNIFNLSSNLYHFFQI